MQTNVTLTFRTNGYQKEAVVPVGDHWEGLDAAFLAFNTFYDRLTQKDRLEMTKDGIDRIIVNGGRNHREWMKGLVTRVRIGG